MRVCDVLTNLEAPASHPTGAVLMESVCRGELRRPLHSKETLLPTILKWAEWSEEDRKNNQLVFARHPIIDQLLRLEKVYIRQKIFHNKYSLSLVIFLFSYRIYHQNPCLKSIIPVRKTKTFDNARSSFAKLGSPFLKI